MKWVVGLVFNNFINCLTSVLSPISLTSLKSVWPVLYFREREYGFKFNKFPYSDTKNVGYILSFYFYIVWFYVDSDWLFMILEFYTVCKDENYLGLYKLRKCLFENNFAFFWKIFIFTDDIIL